MESNHIKFYNHLFLYTLSFLLIVVICASYYRFIIKHDYMVEYEGACDPASEKCFEGCADDACTEKSYYSKVTKYAPDLYNECGEDITNCENANICLLGDKKCSISYCNPEIDGDICSKITEEPNIEDSNSQLQDNNITNI